MATAAIIDEFSQLIDVEKEYDLKELKQILADVYNTKNGKKKAASKAKNATKSPSSDDTASSSDEEKPKKRGRPAKVRLDKDGNPKAKKAPSAYNNYVKQTITTLKKQSPEVPARELMQMAAASWKSLTQEEKDNYKTAIIDDKDNAQF